MNISNDGIAITKRFFEAIECLRKTKKIRGLQTFTRSHNMNYWNTCTVRNQPDKSVLKPEWLAWLVQDYSISALWLLTGEGEMTGKKSATSSSKRQKDLALF